MSQAGTVSQSVVEAPFEVSNACLDNAVSLRQQMEQQGCLFFQGLIPADSILAARREILARCAEAGWLQPGTETEDGIAAAGVAWTEPQPEFMAVYNRVQQGEAFHALSQEPELLAMFDGLFGEQTLAHPRNIARIIFPRNTDYTTPSHQDYVHVQGTEETYTAWIPLGSCPREMGSLAVLAGSHRAGIFPVHRALGAGGVGIDTSALPYPWVGSDFALGDVVVFHSLAVHKALPNLSRDRIRLSVDFRYQPLSHPISEDSLRPHHSQLTWPDIYAGWRSDRHQYYWQRLPIRMAERDPRVHEIRSRATQM